MKAAAGKRAGSNPSRVLFAVRFDGGGSITGLHDLVRGLDRDRYEPVVLFYEDSPWAERFEALGARVRILQPRRQPEAFPRAFVSQRRKLRNRLRFVRETDRLLRRTWPLARRIARVVREEGADLVYHNDNPRAHRASILAGILARRPQICHARSFTEYYRPIDRGLSLGVDLYLHMSRAIEAQVLRDVGVPARKSRVLYDPFDLSEYEGAAAARSRVRGELGLEEGHTVVCNVGRIVRWKGQDHFLEGMAAAAVGRPDLRVLVVGSGDDREDGRAFREELEAIAARPELRDRVVFTGFRRDVPELMAASDIIVHSSSEPEPFGRVIVEAMAVGRPVVATAAGGALEIVEEGKTGLLVPPGDAGAMAEAVLRLAERPEEAARMGRRGRRAAEARFSLEGQCRAFQAAYDRVLGRVPAGSTVRVGDGEAEGAAAPRGRTPEVA